jgi:hypothetical protein
MLPKIEFWNFHHVTAGVTGPTLLTLPTAQYPCSKMEKIHKSSALTKDSAVDISQMVLLPMACEWHGCSAILNCWKKLQQVSFFCDNYDPTMVHGSLFFNFILHLFCKK